VADGEPQFIPASLEHERAAEPLMMQNCPKQPTLMLSEPHYEKGR